MLRLVSAATQQRRRGKDMSLLRRLILQGRLILKNYPSIFGGFRNGEINFGRGKLPTKDKTFIRIDGRSPPRSVGNFGNGPSSGQTLNRLGGTSSFNSSGSTTWQRIGSEIQSQVRNLFVNNVLRRATTNQEVARKAAQRLLYGDSRNFFALVGVSLATGSAGILTKESEFEGICWEIRESIRKKCSLPVEDDTEIEDQTPITSVADLTFGPILNKGCSAAVYAARFNDNSSALAENGSEWPLAVKMLFNYDIESNAFAILKGMVKEIVPARRIDLKTLYTLEKSLFDNVKRCTPHENIIDVKSAFADQVPMLSEGIERYPSALPRRLNPNDGLGRNMSLFLIMKRYDTSLQAYLETNRELRFRTRMLIFIQVCNGVAHLERSEIAHRDLKTDNILIDVSQGNEYPEIVISDFGCCLADKTHGMKLPFTTYDTDRGGNAALTAPEISTAVPGPWKYLSYKKSDAWTVGAIAYEIFGHYNPFYGKPSDSIQQLDSRTYNEADIPIIEGLSPFVQSVITQLLRRNPDKRMSAEEAYYICMIILWAPSQWLVEDRARNEDEILQWMVCLTTKALCRNSDELEYKMISSFLARVKFSNVKKAVRWILQMRNSNQ